MKTYISQKFSGTRVSGLWVFFYFSNLLSEVNSLNSLGLYLHILKWTKTFCTNILGLNSFLRQYRHSTMLKTLLIISGARLFYFYQFHYSFLNDSSLANTSSNIEFWCCHVILNVNSWMQVIRLLNCWLWNIKN